MVNVLSIQWRELATITCANLEQRQQLLWHKNVLISQLKVVNDLAERSIKLMSDYSTIITNDEEQKQCLLQTVEDQRKKYPDGRKQTLKLM